MIVCPNCSHPNPDSAIQCEACYTPLPALAVCPSCGAAVQSDASFCGQCGFDLRPLAAQPASPPPTIAVSPPGTPSSSPAGLPNLIAPDPLVEPEPIQFSPLPSASSPPPPSPEAPLPDLPSAASPSAPPVVSESGVGELPASFASAGEDPSVGGAVAPPPAARFPGTTQLQVVQARLLHVQSNGLMEIPAHLTTVHLGKPNDRVPPDIDVSGFPDSEIVSRVHATIRVEGDVYYIEDVGSSNGTYINNMPLPVGNRHRLRPGDRIALGKGDKVTFIFQVG